MLPGPHSHRLVVGTRAWRFRTPLPPIDQRLRPLDHEPDLKAAASTSTEPHLVGANHANDPLGHCSQFTFFGHLGTAMMFRSSIFVDRA